MRPIALALFAGLLAAPAAAQGTFTWVYDAHFPVFPSEARLNLIATSDSGLLEVADNDDGLPGGIIWARCLSEFDAGEVAIRFEAFAGAAQAGDTVDLDLAGSDGSSFTLPGVIFNREFTPTGGPEIIVQAAGPVMAMFANSDTVSYGVSGLTDFFLEFDLSTNRPYVTAFIEDCVGVAAGGALQRAPDETAGAGAVPDAGPDLVPDLGPDISGHVWSRFSEVSDNPFETILDVFYGVPETDDIAVHGSCFIGAQGPLVRLSAAADVIGLRNGDLAELRFSIPDGRSAVVPGTVVGVDAEVGVAGVEIVLEMSDPAWLTIAGDEILRIERVGAQEGLTITGNGPNTLGTFIADCAEIGDLQPESGLTPSAPIGAQPGFLSCAAQGRVASRDTGTPLVVNFVNATQGYRALLWFDPYGLPVEVAGLNPGQAAAYTTDPGHVWMATDGPGNCREMIQPAPGQSEYRLTVEN